MKEQPTHVYPINDLYPHEIENNNCVCEPNIEENGLLVIHNSFDGREYAEEGKKISTVFS